MGTLSIDGDTYISDGSWQFCRHCDAAAYVWDPIDHEPDCPKRRDAPAPRPNRTSDPNLCVITPSGIERAMDVQKRRRR